MESNAQTPAWPVRNWWRRPPAITYYVMTFLNAALWLWVKLPFPGYHAFGRFMCFLTGQAGPATLLAFVVKIDSDSLGMCFWLLLISIGIVAAPVGLWLLPRGWVWSLLASPAVMIWFIPGVVVAGIAV